MPQTPAEDLQVPLLEKAEDLKVPSLEVGMPRITKRVQPHVQVQTGEPSVISRTPEEKAAEAPVPTDPSAGGSFLLDQANKLNQDYIVPAKEHLQSMIRPQAEKSLQALGLTSEQTPSPGPLHSAMRSMLGGPGGAPSALLHQGMAALGGPEVNQPGPLWSQDDYNEAQHSLSRMFGGDHGGAIAKFFVDTGMDPSNLLMLIPGLGEVAEAGKAREAVGVLPKLAEAAKGLAEGALHGAGWGAASVVGKKGETFQEGAKTGSIFGATVHAGAQAISRVIGLVGTKGMRRLTQELLDESSKMEPSVEPPPASSKPSIAAIHVRDDVPFQGQGTKAEGGRVSPGGQTVKAPVAIVFDPHSGKVHVMDLQNKAALEKWGKYRDANPNMRVIAGDDSLFELDQSDRDRIFGGQWPSSPVIEGPGRPHYLMSDGKRLTLKPLDETRADALLHGIPERPAKFGGTWAPVLVNKPGKPPQLARLLDGNGEKATVRYISEGGEKGSITEAVPQHQLSPLPQGEIDHKFLNDSNLAATVRQLQPEPPTRPEGYAAAERHLKAGGVAGGGAGKPPPPSDIPNGEVPAVRDPGPARPPPVPTPGPGQLPDWVGTEAAHAQDMLQQHYAPKSLGQKVHDFFVAPGMGMDDPAHRRAYILASRAARHIGDVIGNDTLQAIRKAAGGKLDPSFDREIERAALGEKNAHVLESYPQWQKLKETMEPLFRRRDENDKLIASLGGIPDTHLTDREAGARDGYMARMYMAKIKPQEWARYVSHSSKMEDALKYLAQRNPKGFNASEAARQISDILGSPDPIASWNQGPMSKAFGSLKALKDIPTPIRELMGEIHSGAYRMAVSLGRQEAIISNLKMFQELAQDKENASHDFRPGWKQLPDSPQFGVARGMSVHPDIYDSIVHSPETSSRASEFVRALSSERKKNLISLGGFGPIMHHSAGNVWSSVLAGGLDPFHPIESGKNFKDAFQAMRQFSKNPYAPGLGEYKLEAMKLGAVSPGMGAMEMDSAGKKMMRTLEAEIGKTGDHWWDHLGVVSNFLDKYQEFGGKASEYYDHVNQWFQLANYMGLRKKFLGQGMPLEEARRLAAQRVQQSFVNYHNVSPFLQKLQAIGIGGFIPTTTPLVEQMRIIAQLPWRFARERDLRYRLGAFGALIGGGFVANHVLRTTNGVSQPEVDNAYSQLPDWQKEHSPVMFTHAFRDNQGRVLFQDLTHYFPLFNLLRGNPHDGHFNRVLSNIATLPVEGTPLEEAWKKQIANTGLISPPNEPRARAGEASILALLHQANRSGLLGPAAISRLSDPWTAKSNQNLTFGEKTAKTFGQQVYAAKGNAQLEPYRKATEDLQALAAQYASKKMTLEEYQKKAKEIQTAAYTAAQLAKSVASQGGK